jgi:hypothetical protein
LTLGKFTDKFIIDLDVEPLLVDMYYLEDFLGLEAVFRSDAGYKFFGSALYKINCLIMFLLR